MHTGRQSVVRKTSLSTTAAEITGPSQNRVAILFLPNDAFRFSISPESTIVIDEGMTLQVGGPSIELTLEEHGEIVQRGWYAIAPSGTPKIAWLETFEGDLP